MTPAGWAKALGLCVVLVALAPTAGGDDRAISLPAGARVEVFAPHTEVVVRGSAGRGLRITARAGDGVRVEETAGRVRILVPEPVEAGSLLVLRLPPGHALAIEAAGAPVTVAGVRGDVVVRQVAAPVEVRGVVGSVDVLNRHQRTRIERVDGDVRAESHTHHVELEDVTGNVWARSATGFVTALRAGGLRVELASVTGHAAYRGTVRSDGRYELSSHSGEVILEVPAKSRATVRLTGNPDAFDVAGVRLSPAGPNGASVRLGELGDGESGGGEIALRSFSGAIRLRVE